MEDGRQVKSPQQYPAAVLSVLVNNQKKQGRLKYLPCFAHYRPLTDYLQKVTRDQIVDRSLIPLVKSGVV